MVKRGILAAALLLVALSIGAVTDLDEPVYSLLSRWEDRGLIGPLPLVRPYPPQLIRSCLLRVAASGGREDRGQAVRLLEELDGAGALLPLGAEAAADVSTYGEFFARPDAGESFFRPAAIFGLAGDFSETFAYEGRLGLFFNKEQDADYAPYLEEPDNFYHSGGGAGGAVTFEHLWLGGIFWGSESLYFQAGLMRTAFGPFFDNSAVLGSQAPEAGHFSFSYRGKRLTFSSLMLQLIARYAVNVYDNEPVDGYLSGELFSLKGTLDPGVYPSKYLVIHSVDVRAAGWLNLGFVQTVIYGGRFDPLYLIPFQDLAGTQTYTGDYDNNLLGLYARFFPLPGLTACLLLYIDDLNMNEIMKLNFNSDQNKLAFQAGLAWSPEHFLSPRLTLNYLLLTPYMYSHLTRAPITYLTYTHYGHHLGSTLEPNSDQLSLKASLFLRRLLAAELTARYVRHGNHSATYVPAELQGTLWDDGLDTDGNVTFYGPSTFLAQDVLERTLQLGCSLTGRLPLSRLAAELRAEAGYTFEAIRNPGFVDGASETNHYLRLLLGLDW
jgi:hypothetical protein